MRLLKTLATTVVVTILTGLGVGLLLPKTAHVERTTAIHAPPAVVFGQINDLATWHTWSPWAAKDPTLVTEVGDPSVGVGATSRWHSEKSGSGSQTITRSIPNRRVEADGLQRLKAYVEALPVPPPG